MNKIKVLLIALNGYTEGICKKMSDMGIDVTYMNDKPNNGVICKTLGRLKIPLYLKYIEKYYKNKFNLYKENNFDYILVIRGEYTPHRSLELMNDMFPKSQKVLYMWDSIQNNKGITEKWKYFDRIITFDRLDYMKYQSKIEFLPLFYYEDYLPDIKNNQPKYDIAFIGTGHGDRIKIVQNIKEQCKSLGLVYYLYIFLPHILIYAYNKIKNPCYKGARAKDFHYKMLPFEKVYELYGNATCVVDIESSTQSGLTMRTIEMIGLQKKLITTNRDIVNYEIYNSNNIMVVDRDNFVLNKEFLETDYEPLSSEVYAKYSLESWIKTVLCLG